MSSPKSPPVFILGCHRSGTSVVTGLLANAGGLHLGDVLPPTPANPRGYFESSAAVVAHNRLLAAMDRDWTCPPSSFDPDQYDLAPFATISETLSAQSELWGLKDPRLLFLLPAWTSILDRIRMVGVARDATEITKSIIRRDGIPPDAAAAIADAYLERLAALEEEFRIPIVDFSGDPATLIDRVRTIADALGLGWDEKAADQFFSTGLVHHSGKYPTSTPNSEALRRAAAISIESVDALPTERVRKFIDGLEISARLYPDVGPRHNTRRAELLRSLPGTSLRQGALELTSTTDPASSMRVGGDWLTSVRAATLDEAVQALSTNATAGRLSLSSIVDDLDDVSLERLLSVAAAFAAPIATAVLDFRGESAGAIHPRAAYPRDAAGLERVAQSAGWRVESIKEVGFDRSIATLVKDLPTDPISRQLIAIRASLVGELDELRESLIDQARRAGEGGYTGGDQSVVELELADTKRQLQRLKNRRSVRLATRVAAFFKPLFRRVRAMRRRT